MCFKYGPCTTNTYVYEADKAVSFRRMLALLEGSPVSAVCHFHKITMGIMNRLELYWSDPDQGEKYSNETYSITTLSIPDSTRIEERPLL